MLCSRVDIELSSKSKVLMQYSGPPILSDPSGVGEKLEVDCTSNLKKCFIVTNFCRTSSMLIINAYFAEYGLGARTHQLSMASFDLTQQLRSLHQADASLALSEGEVKWFIGM